MFSATGGGLPYFRGPVYQRGHGLGSFFGGLLRGALPLLRQGAKAIGRQALQTGMQIMGDVVENKPFKLSLRSRLHEAGQNLQQKANNKIKNIITGGGRKRARRKILKKNNKKSSNQKSRQPRKRKASIRFGPPLISPQSKRRKSHNNTRDIFSP